MPAAATQAALRGAQTLRAVAAWQWLLPLLLLPLSLLLLCGLLWSKLSTAALRCITAACGGASVHTGWAVKVV